jgi:hypothetical protein
MNLKDEICTYRIGAHNEALGMPDNAARTMLTSFENLVLWLQHDGEKIGDLHAQARACRDKRIAAGFAAVARGFEKAATIIREDLLKAVQEHS